MLFHRSGPPNHNNFHRLPDVAVEDNRARNVLARFVRNDNIYIEGNLVPNVLPRHTGNRGLPVGGLEEIEDFAFHVE